MVAGPVTLSPAATSYFSAPENGLDPVLFQGSAIRPWVRNGILSLLLDHLGQHYLHPEYWVRVWIAGSGVSYQWRAARQPGDLDVLVGVDYVEFRRANPAFVGLSDAEISHMMNAGFREELHPRTEDWNDYEVTFYVNPGATDIRTIKPYAAYDLTFNEWTVPPNQHPSAPAEPGWENTVQSDERLTRTIINRYEQALVDVQNAQNDAARRNGEYRLKQAVEQGAALFDELHGNRRMAFQHGGQGYADFHNYRWQGGKRTGSIHALHLLKKYQDDAAQSEASETYGVELPDTETLIRRAATLRAGG